MKNLDFNLLDGKTAILCAVDGFKFRLGDLTLEAIEDTCDGYRSMLQELRIVKNIRPTFREEVQIRLSSEINGIEIFNAHGILLRIGTANFNDNYPYFMFNWYPELLSSNFDLNRNLYRLLTTVTEVE